MQKCTNLGDATNNNNNIQYTTFIHVYYGNGKILDGESRERLRVKEKCHQQVSEGSNRGSCWFEPI